MALGPTKATLTVREGPQRGQVFELKPTSTVGRSKSCTVAIDDPDASRTHLIIEYDANEYTVRDNGSANGTFLNGRKVTVAALRHGDLVRAGGTTLVFQIGVVAPPSVADTVAAALLIDLKVPPFDSVTARSGVERLAKALEKYKILYQTNEMISALPDDTGYLRVALEKLLDAMAADRGLVLLGTSEESLELAASVSRIPEVAQQPVSTTLLKRVLGAGEALLVKDTLLDERLQDSSSQLATGSRSLVCAPLRTNDALFGAIQLESHRRESAFDENDLQMLAAVARQMAIALSHGQIERTRSEAVERSMLRRFLCSADAERLLRSGQAWREPQSHRLWLLFVDLRPLIAEVAKPGGFAMARSVVDALVEGLHARGGVLSRLTPDALLAFWGAPFMDPEDPRKACEAALDMQAIWRKHPDPKVRSLRCALHWADGLVGEFGSRHRTEYTVLGPDVEDAARFSGQVPFGGVGASEAFYAELSTALEGEWGIPFRLGQDPRDTRLFHVHALKV